MTDLRVWVLGGILGILTPALAYLLTREFKRKDDIGDEVRLLAHKMNDAMSEFNEAVTGLTVALQEMKLWSHEHFVTRSEFKTAMDSLGTAVADAIDRFDERVQDYRDKCPLKGGR